MRGRTESNTYTAADVRIALSEIYPYSAYGAVPVLDQYDALEAYRAYDDGGPQAVPHALAAYVDCHQRRCRND